MDGYTIIRLKIQPPNTMPVFPDNCGTYISGTARTKITVFDRYDMDGVRSTLPDEVFEQTTTSSSLNLGFNQYLSQFRLRIECPGWYTIESGPIMTTTYKADPNTRYAYRRVILKNCSPLGSTSCSGPTQLTCVKSVPSPRASDIESDIYGGYYKVKTRGLISSSCGGDCPNSKKSSLLDSNGFPELKYNCNGGKTYLCTRKNRRVKYNVNPNICAAQTRDGAAVISSDPTSAVYECYDSNNLLVNPHGGTIPSQLNFTPDYINLEKYSNISKILMYKTTGTEIFYAGEINTNEYPIGFFANMNVEGCALPTPMGVQIGDLIPNQYSPNPTMWRILCFDTTLGETTPPLSQADLNSMIANGYIGFLRSENCIAMTNDNSGIPQSLYTDEEILFNGAIKFYRPTEPHTIILYNGTGLSPTTNDPIRSLFPPVYLTSTNEQVYGRFPPNCAIIDAKYFYNMCSRNKQTLKEILSVAISFAVMQIANLNPYKILEDVKYRHEDLPDGILGGFVSKIYDECNSNNISLKAKNAFRLNPQIIFKYTSDTDIVALQRAYINFIESNYQYF